MPNASGFVDFNQQMDLTGDEEQRLLEEAMARAEQATGKAQASLQSVSRDANNQNVADLTQVGSYSDYLAAKRNAADAWAAVTGPDANPRSVRSAVASGRLGAQGRMDAAGRELGSREDEFGRRATEDFAEKNRNRTALEAYRSKESDAAAERQRRGDAAQEQYRQSIYSKWANWDRARRGGTNPGGQVQDFQRYAQQLSQEVDKGWKLPNETEAERNSTTGGDMRGWAIESTARQEYLPHDTRTTKKGTAY